jgi:hypothetical protein
MQRDPLGYVQGMNLYAYAASMAVGLTDPLGLLSLAPPWPPGWHPPMLPPDEGGGDDGEMGPPVPPAVGPCGGMGPLGGHPGPLPGGGGDGGSSGSGDDGIDSGDSGGGGGQTPTTHAAPPIVLPPPPVPPTPKPHHSGKYSGNSTGGGKGARGREDSRGKSVGLFSTTENSPGSGKVAGPDQFEHAAGSCDIPVAVSSPQEAAEVLRELVASGVIITDLYIFDHGGPNCLEVGGKIISPYGVDGVETWSDITENVDPSGTVHVENCEVGADGAIDGGNFVQNLADTGQRCVEAWTGKTAYPRGPVGRLILGPYTNRGNRISRCPATP